jgi:hypothetical protein
MRMNMGQAFLAPMDPEEHMELERNYGVPPPGYLAPMQNAGIIRRPGERLPARNMFRRAAALGLATGNPLAAGVGAAGLVANHAWGNNQQGPMGPPQLRLPKGKKKEQ